MTLTAYLTGGPHGGRAVDLPMLEELPAALEVKTESGTVPYQRVGNSAEYRPATVLARSATGGGKKGEAGA